MQTKGRPETVVWVKTNRVPERADQGQTKDSGLGEQGQTRDSGLAENEPELLPLTAEALAEATLSRIILFNKRRDSEASNLLLQTYATRPNWDNISKQRNSGQFATNGKETA